MPTALTRLEIPKRGEQSGQDRRFPVTYKPVLGTNSGMEGDSVLPGDIPTGDSTDKGYEDSGTDFSDDSPEITPISETEPSLIDLVRSAKAVAAALAASVQPKEDRVDKANRLHSLRNLLNAMWKLRDARQDDWQSLLNMLCVTLNERPDKEFTSDQCVVVSDIVRHDLPIGAIDRDQVRKCRAKLFQVGIDPWEAVSPPDEAAEL